MFRMWSGLFFLINDTRTIIIFINNYQQSVQEITKKRLDAVLVLFEIDQFQPRPISGSTCTVDKHGKYYQW